MNQPDKKIPFQSLAGASGEATVAPAPPRDLKPQRAAPEKAPNFPHQNSNEYEICTPPVCQKPGCAAERPRLMSDVTQDSAHAHFSLRMPTPRSEANSASSFSFSEHSSVFVPQFCGSTTTFDRSDADASSSKPEPPPDLLSSGQGFAAASTDFKLKEKTEICRNWQLNKCRFGDKCAFAHGSDQLLKKTHVDRKYKVTKCRSFHGADAHCMYGTRCQFAHMARNEFHNYAQVLEENARQMQIKVEGVRFPDLTQFNVAAPKLPRLPVFKQITRKQHKF